MTKENKAPQGWQKLSVSSDMMPKTGGIDDDLAILIKGQNLYVEHVGNGYTAYIWWQPDISRWVANAWLGDAYYGHLAAKKWQCLIDELDAKCVCEVDIYTVDEPDLDDEQPKMDVMEYLRKLITKASH